MRINLLDMINEDKKIRQIISILVVQILSYLAIIINFSIDPGHYNHFMPGFNFFNVRTPIFIITNTIFAILIPIFASRKIYLWLLCFAVQFLLYFIYTPDVPLFNIDGFFIIPKKVINIEKTRVTSAFDIALYVYSIQFIPYLITHKIIKAIRRILHYD